jgi:DNA-directed RNA polymerase III subunit RPC4
MHTRTVASPQPGAESAARAPVQRLGSLQGSVPPSRSASPSVRGRGGTTRGKRGVKTPAFTGRRSKEERDAIAKELAARDRERTKEQVAADQKKQSDALRAARREANKLKNARGGFSGVASGPFSLGSSKEGMCMNLAIFVHANLGDRQEEQPKSRFLWFRIRIRVKSRARQE